MARKQARNQLSKYMKSSFPPLSFVFWDIEHGGLFVRPSCSSHICELSGKRMKSKLGKLGCLLYTRLTGRERIRRNQHTRRVEFQGKITIEEGEPEEKERCVDMCVREL